MSDLVGNPEDRLSHDTTLMILKDMLDDIERYVMFVLHENQVLCSVFLISYTVNARVYYI